MKTKFQDLLVGAATRHARACLDETLPQVADSADFQSLIIGNLKKALTPAELISYNSAYVQHMAAKPRDKKSQAWEDAFKKEMERRVRDRIVSEINQKISDGDYPKETRELAIGLRKRIYDFPPGDMTTVQQIECLRLLNQFVQSQNAELPKPLEDHKTYSVLFQRFHKEIERYNTDVDTVHALAVIETRFLYAGGQDNFQEICRENRNCLVFYNNTLYHIDSAQTIKCLAFDTANKTGFKFDHNTVSNTFTV